MRFISANLDAEFASSEAPSVQSGDRLAKLFSNLIGF